MRVRYTLTSRQRRGGRAPQTIILTPARFLTIICIAIVLLGGLATSLGFLLMLGAKLVPFLMETGPLLMKDGLILFLAYRAARLGWLILRGIGRKVSRSSWYRELLRMFPLLKVQMLVELKIYAARARRLIVMLVFLLLYLLWLVGFQ